MSLQPVSPEWERVGRGGVAGGTVINEEGCKLQERAYEGLSWGWG